MHKQEKWFSFSREGLNLTLLYINHMLLKYRNILNISSWNVVHVINIWGTMKYGGRAWGHRDQNVKFINSEFDIWSVLVERFPKFQLWFRWEAWGFTMACHIDFTLVFCCFMWCWVKDPLSCKWFDGNICFNRDCVWYLVEHICSHSVVH